MSPGASLCPIAVAMNGDMIDFRLIYQMNPSLGERSSTACSMKCT